MRWFVIFLVLAFTLTTLPGSVVACGMADNGTLSSKCDETTKAQQTDTCMCCAVHVQNIMPDAHGFFVTLHTDRFFPMKESSWIGRSIPPLLEPPTV